MRLPVLLCLVTSAALASPAPRTRRVSPLLIPMDRGAEARSLQLEGYMNDALAEFPHVILVKSEELFGVPPDDSGEAALKRAEQGYAQGRMSFEATQFEDAERKLKAAINEYLKAASAMRDTFHYRDALAMYAATLFLRGDTEEARLVLLDLLSLDLDFDLNPKRFPRNFLKFRTQVAGSRNANLRGNVHVTSRPAGARIYLNGELQGFTPALLSTLPAGKHVLRLERPGFKQFGTFVEVSPEDTEVNAELRPTSAYRAYDALLDKVAGEVVREKGNDALTALGKTLGLDRAIVGVVKQVSEDGVTELNVGLFDMGSGKRLSKRRVIFQGDEYGQLKNEVARLVTYLLATAEGGRRVVRSSDPLEGKQGTEDWSGESKGNRDETRNRRYRDPLDGATGTEDW